MKALILSAGYGTRLKPITNVIPKVMVEVGGYPVLEHLIFHLHKFGITQIMANLHYKPGAVMDHFGPRLLYSYEPTLLGEEGTINSLRHWFFNDYVVVMNGDTLTNIDIWQMLVMSKDRNVRSMDGITYTGTKIITPSYFFGDKTFVDYFDPALYWQDIGTKEGLERAQQHYEKIGSLS